MNGPPPLPRLHTYFRSSAAFRVRIALNLKRVAYEPVIWHLARGEHLAPAYRDVASFGLVPTLEIDGLRLQQSMAIIEYLDERDPEPPLLPTDRAQRAWARSLAQLVACEVHPLNNLRVLQHLRGPLGVAEQAVNAWYRHWCDEGFTSLEAELQRTPGGPFALGERPSIVDCFLVPQVFNARRFDVDMRRYPRLDAIVRACMQTEAFDAAQPLRQPDAPATPAAH
jgi:maleylacetoacetate isomerase